MTSVDRVKALCKERRIAIYKLEKDLGFGNGYLGQLKKGVLPDDRLYLIANYLGVDPEYISTGEHKKTATNGDGENRAIEKLKELVPNLTPQQAELVLPLIQGLISAQRDEDSPK